MHSTDTTIHSTGRKPNGFTLIELLVSLGLGMLALAALAMFNTNQLHTMRRQAGQVDLQTTARAIADLFASEARLVGMNEDCNVAIVGLLAGSDRRIEFETDLDADGSTGGQNEHITYDFDAGGQTITRTDASTGTPDVLLENIDITYASTKPILQYFDGNGSNITPAGGGALTTAQLKTVRRVRLNLSLTDNTENPPVTAAAATNIEVRNRFFLGQNTLCTPSKTPVMTKTASPTPVPGTPPPTPTFPSSPTPVCAQAGSSCHQANCCAGSICQGNGSNAVCVGVATPTLVSSVVATVTIVANNTATPTIAPAATATATAATAATATPACVGAVGGSCNTLPCCSPFICSGTASNFTCGTTCVPTGGACSASMPCCTGNACTGGVCVTAACLPRNVACTSASFCCSGPCRTLLGKCP